MIVLIVTASVTQDIFGCRVCSSQWNRDQPWLVLWSRANPIFWVAYDCERVCRCFGEALHAKMEPARHYEHYGCKEWNSFGFEAAPITGNFGIILLCKLWPTNSVSTRSWRLLELNHVVKYVGSALPSPSLSSLSWQLLSFFFFSLSRQMLLGRTLPSQLTDHWGTHSLVFVGWCVQADAVCLSYLNVVV